jgi:hypothetical protein
MSVPLPNVGTTFHVSASLPATYDSAEYSALTYTQIRGMRALADIGEVYEVIDWNVIGEVRHSKKVGRASLSLPIEVYKFNDAGQTILKTLKDSMDSYTFRVNATDGTLYYFTAQCSTRTNNVGAADDVNTTLYTLDLDSIVLEV